MPMETASLKDSTASSSPSSSPNIGALLKIRTIQWSQETGLPVSVRVRVGERTFNLHRYLLSLKSGYFKKRLAESTEIGLPPEFPGGPEAFQMIALFIYGSTTMIDPFNIAALRCAAEFLEMTEEYCSGSLCDHFDLYLNQVVLQSWDDTLIVLQRCQTLLPWSEELLIVCRCIESLAFMACMEILDPERRRDNPVVTLEALASQAWNCKTVEKIVSQDLWIKDLIALPFGFFKRIIGSLRRQGMKEKYVSPIVVFYAKKWVISQKTHQFWESYSEKVGDDDANRKVLTILEGILDLLPMSEKTSRLIPVGFYFALLSKSLEVGLRSDIKAKLQDQIAALLHFAHVEDFLVPANGKDSISSSLEVATMEGIFSTYMSLNMDANRTPSAAHSVVAELWDAYLAHLARDTRMGYERFMQLIERVPISFRESHDQLYRAMNTFLQARPEMSQEEKGGVCKYLNCQKLAQEVCVEAVQNELMPLRLIVQALFVQQLNTRQAFKECSDSFRFAHCGDFSGTLSSSRCPNSRNQTLGGSPYTDGAELTSRPLSFFLQKDNAVERCEFSQNEYESTSFRIQNLEQELLSLKRSLQLQNISKSTETMPTKQQSTKPFGLGGRSQSQRRNPVGQVTGCIGSVSFASKRKYAHKIMKVFCQLTLFGSKKSKTKPGAAGLWNKQL